MTRSHPDNPSAPRLFDRRAFIGVAVATVSVAHAAEAVAVSALALAPRFPLHHVDGDGFTAFMAYEPARDPDAAFFRSHVPLAKVIAPFAATQAHPRLDPRPRVATLVKPYGALDDRQGDAFSRLAYGSPPPGGLHVSRMTAWHDLVVGWGGTGMIPNPAMTDAAHRNGALALGVVFQPDHRLYDASVAPRQAVAAKLVALARWFGFDGYFMNFEGGSAHAHAQALDLVGAMRSLGREDGGGPFHVQFYDGHTDIRALAPLPDGEVCADSVMLDQGWSGYGAKPGCCSGRPVSPEAVRDACLASGLDPFAAYYGLQLYPGPGYLGVAGPHVIAPDGDGAAYGSLQLYSADDGLRTLLRLAQATGEASSDPRAGRGALYALERRLYSGGSQDPAGDHRPTPRQAEAYAPTRGDRHIYTHYAGGALRPTDQAGLPLTYGVADFAVERSVIGAAPFLTRFNTGEGERFWIEGERVGEAPWFNMSVQDLLPTWQWRREPQDAATGLASARLLDIDYDFDLAFDGGSSLRISGALDAQSATWFWLYKTAMPLTADGAIRLVFQGASSAIRAEVGLVFEDAPARIHPLPFSDRVAAPLANGWRGASLALAPFAGRTLAAVLIGVAPAAFPRAPTFPGLNIGEMFIGGFAPPAPPPAPTGLQVLAWRPADGGRATELRLGWRGDPAADFHDILHRGADGRPTWLGRVQGDRFYCADAPVGGELEVVSVSRDAPSSRSAPARVRLPE